MADDTHSTIDMKPHLESYQGFIQLTILTVAFCISIVIMLAIGNAGSWGLAGLGTFLALVGATVGFMMKGSPIPIIIGTVIVLGLKLLIG